MRKSPPNHPAPIEIDRSGIDHIDREYEVITPLFGGGVDPGKNDTDRLVRADQINGFLRFWWRACKGGDDVEKMHARESEIWGGKRAGQISFHVTVTSRGKEMAKDADLNFDGVPPYAAFSLADKPDATLRSGVAFKLHLEFPEAGALKPDIEAALWAWETFGGIGSRTRRGFGAIHPTKGAPERVKFGQWLEENIRRHVTAASWPLDVPRLGSIDHYKYRNATSVPAAWSLFIDKLKTFRQARNGFHRSYWPEPDVVRRMTGVVRGHAPVHPVNAFPRGQLGLPIIFDFLGRQNEPPKTTLVGDGFERLASPLILRPFKCSDGVLALAAGLCGSGYIRNDLRLTHTGGAPIGGHVRSSLTVSEAAMSAPWALPPASNKTPLVVNGRAYEDVVEAFLAFL